MWPLSTEPRPVRGSEPTSDPRTAHPGVVGCRFRPQGASAVGVHNEGFSHPPQIRGKAPPRGEERIGPVRLHDRLFDASPESYREGRKMNIRWGNPHY